MSLVTKIGDLATRVGTEFKTIRTEISTAQGAAETYAASAAETAESNANDYTDTAISNLIDSAPATLDTLNELAAALADDASFSTTISTALGLRVRVDEAQSFNSTQKTQGRDNIGAAAASDLGDVSSANFVTTFESALV